MKLLTARSVHHFEQQGHDFCKEITVEFFKCIFWGVVITTIRAPFTLIIFEERQGSLWLISLELGNSHQNNVD